MRQRRIAILALPHTTGDGYAGSVAKKKKKGRRSCEEPELIPRAGVQLLQQKHSRNIFLRPLPPLRQGSAAKKRKKRKKKRKRGVVVCEYFNSDFSTGPTTSNEGKAAAAGPQLLLFVPCVQLCGTEKNRNFQNKVSAIKHLQSPNRPNCQIQNKPLRAPNPSSL